MDSERNLDSLSPAVLETKEIDGTVVTVYEELPDEFTVNVNQETDVQGISPLCATCNQKYYTKVSSWTESSDYNFGWHPGFKDYNRASGTGLARLQHHLEYLYLTVLSQFRSVLLG